MQVIIGTQVDIRFPRSEDPDPNLLIITGKTEDAVLDAVDHIKNMEEEFLQVLLLFA